VLDDQIIGRARSTDPAELARQLQQGLHSGLLTDRARDLTPSYLLEQPDLLLGTRCGVDEGNDWLDALLRTATEAFNAEGSGASIPRMARQLGVSKTMFYRQFSDKQDLLFLCYLRGIGVVEASQRVAELVATDTMDQALVHRHNLYRFHASPCGPFTALNAIDYLRPEQQRFVRHRNHGIRRTSERRWTILRQQQQMHEWIDPVIVQTMFGRLLYWLPARNEFSLPDDLGNVAVEHQNLLYRGLAPL
jgi:AcrR family transcriptional regulator